jgi:hypothetical protein
MGSLQCLTNLKPVIASFSKGDATDDEVASMWDCSAEAVRNFKRYVYGRSEDRFTSDELAKYLEDNFLDPKGPKITPALQAEFMQLKRLIIGGSGESLTRAELDVLVSVIQDLKRMSLHLNPYVKVLVQHWKPETLSPTTAEQIVYFEKAGLALQEVGKDLSDLIQSHHQDYELSHIAPLVKEFAKFTEQEGSLAKVIDAYIPVIEKAKKTVSGGEEKIIAADEWRNFIGMGTLGYLQYLRYAYFVTPAPAGDLAVRIDYLLRSFADFDFGIKGFLEAKPASPECGGGACITTQNLSETLLALGMADPDIKVTGRLVSEVMNAKVLYFGGSPLSFVAADLELGGKKIPELRAIAENLLPWFAIYSFKWHPESLDPVEARRQWQAAGDTLTAQAQRLGALLEDGYNLQSFSALLQEVGQLYPDTIKNFGPLVLSAKGLVFGGADPVVRKVQWTPFLATLSSGCNVAYFYRYFVASQTYGTMAFTDGFKSFGDKLAGFLNGLLTQNPTHTFFYAQIFATLQGLDEAGVLPENLSAASLKKLSDVVISRILWPAELRLRGHPSHDIAAPSVATLQSELQIWFETERLLLPWGEKHWSHSQLQSAVDAALKAANLSPALRTGLSEVRLIVSAETPQVLDRKKRLIIQRGAPVVYDAQSLSQLNLHRAIGRIVSRGVNGDLTRLQQNQGITLSETQAVFALVRPALVELGLVDGDNLTFIESRFREANIFTMGSDGNALANFQEVADLVGMLFSGASINTAFQAELMTHCGVKEHIGRDLTFDEGCVRAVYDQRAGQYMTSMPSFLRYRNRVTPQEFQLFFGYVLTAARHQPNAKHTVRLSTLTLVPHVIQYLEMLYARFDVDRNDVIDTQEALAAYPAFADVLTELTTGQRLIKPKDLPALFTYILYYGTPPEGVSDFLIHWLPWRMQPGKWNVQATRLQVAQIFAFIAEKTRTPSGTATSLTDATRGSVSKTAAN